SHAARRSGSPRGRANPEGLAASEDHRWGRRCSRCSWAHGVACPTWQIAPQRRLSLSEPNLHSKVRTGRKFDRQLPDSWSKVSAGRKFEVAAPYEKLGTSSSLAIR